MSKGKTDLTVEQEEKLRLQFLAYLQAPSPDEREESNAVESSSRVVKAKILSKTVKKELQFQVEKKEYDFVFLIKWIIDMKRQGKPFISPVTEGTILAVVVSADNKLYSVEQASIEELQQLIPTETSAPVYYGASGKVPFPSEITTAPITTEPLSPYRPFFVPSKATRRASECIRGPVSFDFTT